MSVTAMSWALYRAPAKDPTQRLILVHLADHAGRDGRGSYPSVPTIAEDLGVDWRTVRRHLGELERQKVIVRGDQELVSHIRGDRRPVVWDMNLDIVKDVIAPAENDGESLKSDRDQPRKRRPSAPRRVMGDTPSGVHDMSSATPRKPPRHVTDDTPSTRPEASANAPRGVTGGVHGVSPVTPKPRTKPTTKNSLPTVVSSQARARDENAPAAAQQHDATGAGNELLAEHIAACPSRPPRRVTQRTGAEIDELVLEGIPAARIRAGLALLRAKPHLGPALLPQLVHEAAMRPAVGGSYATTGVQQNLAALARGRAAREREQRPDLVIIEGELA